VSHYDENGHYGTHIPCPYDHEFCGGHTKLTKQADLDRHNAEVARSRAAYLQQIARADIARQDEAAELLRGSGWTVTPPPVRQTPSADAHESKMREMPIVRVLPKEGVVL
jgi:hypothetical protein